MHTPIYMYPHAAEINIYFDTALIMLMFTRERGIIYRV